MKRSHKSEESKDPKTELEKLIKAQERDQKWQESARRFGRSASAGAADRPVEVVDPKSLASDEDQPPGHRSAAQQAPARAQEFPTRFRGRVPDHIKAPQRPSVQADVAWAAKELVRLLQGIANSNPSIPEPGTKRWRVPKDAEDHAFHRLTPYSSAADGHHQHIQFEGEVRDARSQDFLAVRKAYEAFTGSKLEDAWELALAYELTQEVAYRIWHAMRGGTMRGELAPPGLAAELSEFLGSDDTPGASETITGKLTGKTLEVTMPEPRRPEEILAAVRRRSPPGTGPEFVTARVIDRGLSQVTDAPRGGGPGSAKMSVETWIKTLKAAARAQACRRRKRR